MKRKSATGKNRIKITNLVKFYSLLLLYEKPHHGYDLIKEIGKKSGKKISPAEIYPFLSELKRNGYLKIVKKGSRDKKTYMLSAKGKIFAKEMMERFANIIEFAISSSVKRCAHCSCEIYRGWYEKKTGRKKIVFCCKNCAEAYSGVIN